MEKTVDSEDVWYDELLSSENERSFCDDAEPLDEDDEREDLLNWGSDCTNEALDDAIDYFIEMETQELKITPDKTNG